MAWNIPYTFATMSGNVPASYLDSDFSYLVTQGLQGNGANYAVDSGSANAYVGIYTPLLTTPVDGMTVYLKAGSTSSTTCTFALDGGTAYPIYDATGYPISTAGAITSGQTYQFIFNNSLGSGAGGWTLASYIPPTPIILGALNGYNTISTSETIPLNQLNSAFYISASGITITLPSSGSVPLGSTLYLWNASSGAITLAGNITSGIGTSTTSISMSAGNTGIFVFNGTGWVAYGGSMQISPTLTATNVTSSRAINTVYTNSTGHMIYASINIASNNTYVGYLNGIPWTYVVTNSSYFAPTMYLMIPAGYTYELVTTGVFSTWTEFR